MTANPLRSVLLSTVLILLAGCGPSSPAELMEAAQRAVEAGELRTAEIHLKNLLQDQPEDAAARLLLGQVSLSLGNAVGAEQELRRAIELGADRADVLVPLLRALIAQGKYQEAVEEAARGPELEGRSRIDALALTGAAHEALGAYGEAEVAYREALEQEPGSPELRTELASVLAETDRVREAMVVIADVLSEQPQFVPALLLRGNVELKAGRYAAAEATFRGVVKQSESNPAAPDYAVALAQLVQAQLAQRKIDAAAASAQLLLATRPSAPVARHLTAAVEAEQGDVDGAAQRLEQIVADFPEYWPAYGLLGSIKLRQEQLGQAKMYLQAAVTNLPEDGTARLALAEVYVREGDLDEARELVTGGEAGAGDALFFALVGRANLAAGQPEQAAEYFEQSEAAPPQSTEELVGVAGVYAASGEFERAIRLIEGASLDDALSRYLLTLVRLRQGDVAAAAETARALAEDLPEAALPLNLQGAIALRAGDLAGASELFSRALEIEPDNVPALFNAARLAVVRNDREQANAQLRRIVEIDPENAGATLALAALALEARDFAGARTWLDRVPSSPQRLRLEGELAVAESRFEEAASAFSRAFAAQPSADLAFRSYAAARRAGRPEPEADLVVWSERNPGDVAARFALSTIALERGDQAQAVERLESVIAAQPNHAAALNNLAWLYSERGDARAETLARRAQAAQPENPSIADTLGWILLRNGNAAEAVPYLERAAAGLPDQPEVAYHLGAALEESGDTTRALAVLRGALETGTDFSGRADAEERVARLAGP